jgi:dolichyl-diphosphooligosaccharide--protein glycosyltransferase
MSNRREQLSEERESQAMVALLEDYYHVPVLIVLLGFVLWNRIRNYGNFIVDGTVYLNGNDPWYHLRMTEYTVENFPRTMPFDPWTYFPKGTNPEQFGTIFDQMIALVALVIGLGDPSTSLVRKLFLVSPAFFALLACIPGYFIGKRLGGKMGGLIVVGVVAFVPDRFMLVTIAGNTQHEALEVVFMALSILGMMAALRYAEKEKPVYELVLAREFDAMRGTIGYSMLAGVAMGMYLWTWPPGLWLFGILSIFFTIHLSLEHIRGRSPEHAAFVGSISMATAGIMALSTTRQFELTEVIGRSLLHPALAFASAAGVLFLAWLSRELDSRDLPKYAYPATIAGTFVVVFVFMSLALPELLDFFTNQVNRVFGFITPTSGVGGTIGEVSPMEFSTLRDTYVFGIFTAGLGAVAILIGQFIDDEPKGEELLVVLWGVMMLFATLTQVRFAYYMTIVVGALNAAFVGYAFKAMGSSDREFKFETYQVLTVVVVFLVMFAPLLGAPLIKADTTATEFSDGVSSPGNVVAWDDSLQYMNENTPREGQYGSPDNDPMALYGDFEQTEDYEYPDGTYGVMSWWDYGHWITQRGQRIPNANPFQEGSGDAAEFLLAQSEEEGLDELSDVDENENAQTRYVMIDWLMAETESAVGGKFFAPPEFVNDHQLSDFTTQLASINNRRFQPITRFQKQAYYETMVARLYHFHGSAQDPRPIVVQWSGQERNLTENGARTFVEAPTQGQNPVQTFTNMSSARQYVENNPTAQIGGLGALPSERVDGLEHFRLVHMSDIKALPQTREEQQRARDLGIDQGLLSVAQQEIWNSGLGEALAGAPFQQLDQQTATRVEGQATNLLYPNTPAFTKTFERVPGGTIQGTGPANTTLSVSVELNPENGRNFTYRRYTETDDSGNFEIVVPYSTTGYDEYGVEEGYTEPAVQANGPYQIASSAQQSEDGNLTIWQGTVNVTEGQVIGEETSPATVELEQQELNIGGSTGDGESNSEDSDDSESDSSNGGSDGSSGDDSESDSDGSGSDSGDSLYHVAPEPTGSTTAPAIR